MFETICRAGFEFLAHWGYHVAMLGVLPLACAGYIALKRRLRADDRGRAMAREVQSATTHQERTRLAA